MSIIYDFRYDLLNIPGLFRLALADGVAIHSVPYFRLIIYDPKLSIMITQDTCENSRKLLSSRQGIFLTLSFISREPYLDFTIEQHLSSTCGLSCCFDIIYCHFVWRLVLPKLYAYSKRTLSFLPEFLFLRAVK
jgi:hypothetical protein